MILYKWKIFAILGKMNVVQESLSRARQCSNCDKISNLQKQLYNNKKHIEILELKASAKN